MKTSFLISRPTPPQGELGSPVSSNLITRRSFLKRTGGATVGVIVASHMMTLRADADEADEGSGSSSWVMVCGAPIQDAKTTHIFNVVASETCPAQQITFELKSSTTQYKDMPPLAGYTTKSFRHTFTLQASDTTGATPTPLKTVTATQEFDVVCLTQSGNILGDHNIPTSNPALSGNPDIIIHDIVTTCSRDYDLNLIIVEPAISGNGTKDWEVITQCRVVISIVTGAGTFGPYKIPAAGFLNFKNTFTSFEI